MSCEGDPIVVANRRIRRARKQHTCCACDRAIEPGQLYSYNFLVWGGDTETYRRCGACEVTWQHLLELCEEWNRRRFFDERRYPDEELKCGLKYGDEWDGDPPVEIAALPFISADEASALLEPARAVQ